MCSYSNNEQTFLFTICGFIYSCVNSIFGSFLAVSTLFTSTRTSKPSFRSNFSTSFAKKRSKPTRKTGQLFAKWFINHLTTLVGKLTSENHSFKTTIITPSSWKESKDKVKVALNGSKTSKPVVDQVESKPTSSCRGTGLLIG